VGDALGISKLARSKLLRNYDATSNSIDAIAPKTGTTVYLISTARLFDLQPKSLAVHPYFNPFKILIIN
jgi:hypothetical protein